KGSVGQVLFCCPVTRVLGAALVRRSFFFWDVDSLEFLGPVDQARGKQLKFLTLSAEKGTLSMTDERITDTLASQPEWHFIHAGKELGPFSLGQLIEKTVAGDIDDDDLVKQTGGLWTKAHEFNFLREAHADCRRQCRQQPLLKDSKDFTSQGPLT